MGNILFRQSTHVPQKPNSSKGENKIAEVLTSLKIKFQREYVISTFPHRRYDFYFVVGKYKYLLEYDGEQHFKHINFFHKTIDEFLKYQQIDREKTFNAIKNKYKVIRIDYTQNNDIELLKYHIKSALRKKYNLYLSNKRMYDYLFNK